MAPDDSSGIPGGEGFGAESAQLLEKLEDRSIEPEERLLATKLAGDLTQLDDGLAEALLRIARSEAETEELRCGAAIALGPVLEEGFTMGFDFAEDVAVSEEMYERLRRGLRELCEDESLPRDVRRCALEASVRAPAPWQQDDVRAALASDDPLWRATGVFSAGFVDGFNAPILEALDDGDPRIAREAVLAAGRQSLPEAYGRIKDAATSTEAEREYRLAAVEALSGYASEDAYATLVELSDGPDDEIAEMAEYGLSLMVAPLGSGFGDDFDFGLDED